MNEEENIVVLTDEEGNEHEFSLIRVIEVDDAEYAILLPLTAEEDGEEEEGEEGEEGEVIILKILTDENGEEVLVDIEDDEEWEKVADACQEILDEEFE